MAYSYTYIYFGICTSAVGDASYIRFPNKNPIYISQGTRIGSTYSLVYSGGTATYAVYRYLYSTYANYIDIDNRSNAWIDNFGNNSSSLSSYTSLQYTSYKVWKFDSSISVQSNSSLRTAVANAGDSQSTSVVVYLFHPNVIDSTYDGSYVKWKSASGSYNREFKYHSVSNISADVDTNVNIGFTSSSTGTRIIKLCTSGYNNSLFKTFVTTSTGGSASAISLNTSGYKGYNLTDLTTSGTLSTSDNGVDKVYVLHNTGFTALSLYGAVSGRCYSYNGSINEVIGRYYYTSTGFDTWVSHNDMSNNKAYFGFTGKTNSLFKKTSLSVQVGYTYTFNLHTYSQVGSDGILISTSDLSSGTYNTATGRIGRCSGINVTSSCTYTPSANGTVYLYFITDSSNLGNESGYYDRSDTYHTSYDGYTYGDVKVTRSAATFTVTLNDFGGNNGQGTVTATYGQNLPTVTVPMRGGGSFTFLGYYTFSSMSIGDQYIDSSGNGSVPYTLTGNTTLFAKWKNTITYNCNLVNSGTPTVYTTSSPSAKTTTDSQRTGTVSTSGWSCASGTVTRSRIDSSSWSISDDGKTVYVPSGVAASYYSPINGNTQIIVKLTSPQGANLANADTNFFGDSITVFVPVNVASTFVSSYGSVTLPSVKQLPLPASGITLTSSNIHSYISLSNAQQTVTYNNGATRSGEITYAINGAVGVGSTTFSVEGRGNTYASTTRNISIGTGLLVPVAYGEGGVNSSTGPQYHITSLVQDSNPVTSVAVTVASNPINYNATTNLTITATYKSTSTRTITSLSSPESGVTLSVTTNPSNIISIT